MDDKKKINSESTALSDEQLKQVAGGQGNEEDEEVIVLKGSMPPPPPKGSSGNVSEVPPYQGGPDDGYPQITVIG